jgi:hypothetical protein
MANTRTLGSEAPRFKGSCREQRPRVNFIDKESLGQKIEKVLAIRAICFIYSGLPAIIARQNKGIFGILVPSFVSSDTKDPVL